jgi:hypothetical protein
MMRGTRCMIRGILPTEAGFGSLHGTYGFPQTVAWLLDSGHDLLYKRRAMMIVRNYSSCGRSLTALLSRV